MATVEKNASGGDGGSNGDTSESGGGGGLIDSALSFLMEPLGAGVGIGLVIALVLGYYIL